MEKGEELVKFIDEWKIKISQLIKINANDIYLINPKKKNELFSLDFTTNEFILSPIINKLNNYNEVNSFEEKPLLEGCQLNIDIFDEEGNKFDNSWGIGEKRGNEDYIPPLGWVGYGLKVKGKYDNGDDTWIDFLDKEGVFAVAYFGVSNIYGNKKKI